MITPERRDSIIETLMYQATVDDRTDRSQKVSLLKGFLAGLMCSGMEFDEAIELMRANLPDGTPNNWMPSDWSPTFILLNGRWL